MIFVVVSESLSALQRNRNYSLREEKKKKPQFQAEMFNLICSLSCVLAFVSSSQSVLVDRDEQGFLDNVLLFYGENNSISVNNLNDLLLIISERRSEDVISGENPLANQEVSTYCLLFICITVSLLFKVMNERHDIEQGF